MRILESKYTGVCSACGEPYAIGEKIAYEKITGCFHPACEPKDSVGIRAFRQMKAEAKAAKYAGWAQKREEKNGAILEHINTTYHNDVAFNTQPGHIPFRARIIAKEDRAFGELAIAKKMREKAENILNGVRVKGDAEKVREEKREGTKAWLKVGMRIKYWRNEQVIKKINKKTATVEEGFTIDLSHIFPDDVCGQEAK